MTPRRDTTVVTLGSELAANSSMLEWLDRLPFGVAILAADGALLGVNSCFADIFDCDRTSLLTHGVAELLPRSVWMDLTAQSGTLAQTDPSRAGLFEIICDQERKGARACIVPLQPEHGCGGSHALVLEDVSELLFAGDFDDDDCGVPPRPTAEPFVDGSLFLRPGPGNGLLEQLLEPLSAEVLLLRGSPLRVAYANVAARTRLAWRIGEQVQLETPGASLPLAPWDATLLSVRRPDLRATIHACPGGSPTDVDLVACIEPIEGSSELVEAMFPLWADSPLERPVS